MKHLGLFEGMGGFSLATRWMGWQTVAWCEWNEFNQKILKYHFPEAIGHGDITKTDFTPYANTIDLLTGGFPCQPYSTAGKRKGKEDERHLWPEMLRAIREVKPRFVVGENVRGLINWSGGMVFNEVQADLEAEGYEVLPFLLPACAVNAPHRRDRIWIIAHANSYVHKGGLGDRGHRKETAGGKGANQRERETPFGQWLRAEPGTSGKDAANSNAQGLQIGVQSGIGQDNNQAGASQGRKPSRTYPTPDWEKFPTQSPVCSRDDGVSGRLDTAAISFSKWRTESIKSAGNAIVPQVAYEIFKAIQQLKIEI